MSKPKKILHELPDGRILTFVEITSETLPIGLQRKTRNLPEGQKEEEIFWLVLETFLTEEELAVWDSLSQSDVMSFQEKLQETVKK